MRSGIVLLRRINCGVLPFSNCNIKPNSSSSGLRRGFKTLTVHYSTNNTPINSHLAPSRERSVPVGEDKKSNFGGAVSHEADERLMENIRSRLRKAKQEQSGFNEVIKELKTVQQKNLGHLLNTQDFDIGFWGCSVAKGSKPIAHWLYDELTRPTSQSSLPPVPADLFEKMMEICRNTKDAEHALKIHKDFKTRDYPMTAKFLANFIIILAENGQTDADLSIMEDSYKDYKVCSVEKGWKPDQAVYGALAFKYCKIGEGQNAVKILEDLIACQEPSVNFSTDVLETALMLGNLEVIRFVASWFSTHFNVPLKHGILSRIFELAAYKGDGSLGSLAAKLTKEAGYCISSSQYFCLLRAHLVRDNHYVPAIELLQAMEETNLDLKKSSGEDAHNTELQQDMTTSNDGVYFNTRQYESIKKLLISALVSSGSADDLDKLYFGMVDQVRHGKIVPRIALDAIVEASGRLDMTDRAFATFREYKGLFNIHPDIHSYNSLLASCAYARNINMHTLLSVFQDLDDAVEGVNSKPNSTSFSLLIEAMVDSDDFRVFDAVFAHMIESGVEPTPRALRRAIVAFLKRGYGKAPRTGVEESDVKEDLEKAEMLMDTLKKQQHNSIPKWFIDRINLIRPVDSQ